MATWGSKAKDQNLAMVKNGTRTGGFPNVRGSHGMKNWCLDVLGFLMFFHPGPYPRDFSGFFGGISLMDDWFRLERSGFLLGLLGLFSGAIC